MSGYSFFSVVVVALVLSKLVFFVTKTYVPQKVQTQITCLNRANVGFVFVSVVYMYQKDVSIIFVMSCLVKRRRCYLYTTSPDILIEQKGTHLHTHTHNTHTRDICEICSLFGIVLLWHKINVPPRNYIMFL